MKKLYYFLFVAILCVAFAGCSKDNDEANNETPNAPEQGGGAQVTLVGTWRHNFSTGYILIYFGPSGKGWEQEYDEADGGWYDKETFSYTYSSTRKTITISYDGENERYNVLSLTNTELVLQYEDEDDEITRWTRVSDQEVNGGSNNTSVSAKYFVGTWDNYKDYYDGEYEYYEEGEYLLRFKNDGTGYWIEEGEIYDQFKWEYDSSYLYFTFRDDDGEEETEVMKVKIVGDDEMAFVYKEEGDEWLEFWKRKK